MKVNKSIIFCDKIKFMHYDKDDVCNNERFQSSIKIQTF